MQRPHAAAAASGSIESRLEKPAMVPHCYDRNHTGETQPF